MITSSVFRAYDIRGIVDIDFDETWVHRLGQAIGTYLLEKGITSMVLGMDCRHSSPAYHEALTQGALSTGLDVISVGAVPTPVLYYAVVHLQKQGGVMITASHNPSEYNGFKIWAGTTTIHGDEILRIRTLFEEGTFPVGCGVASCFDILSIYMDDVVSKCSLGRPMRVVIDGGNGMGGLICTEILQRMGVSVDPLYCEPDGDFPNHHPDPVILANMQDCIARVKEIGADMGVGLDGDADRLGVIDASGRLLFGDELVSLYARELLERKPGSTIIADVKCSKRLFDDIAQHGGNPMMWTTGHSIMKARMHEIDAPLAGEMSGHMFFQDDWYGFDDAIYGTARLIALLSKLDTDLVNLPGWPCAHTTPEINIPCPDAIKFEVVKKAQAYFRERYETIEIDGARVHFKHGWGLIRASNTQPVLVTRFEADSEEHLQEIRDCMEKPLMVWLCELTDARI